MRAVAIDLYNASLDNVSIIYICLCGRGPQGGGVMFYLGSEVNGHYMHYIRECLRMYLANACVFILYVSRECLCV